MFCGCGFWKRCGFCESLADVERKNDCGCVGFQRCSKCTRCDKCGLCYPCVKYYSKAQGRELFRCTYCVECTFCTMPDNKWSIPIAYVSSAEGNGAKKYYSDYDMVCCSICYPWNSARTTKEEVKYIFEAKSC